MISGGGWTTTCVIGEVVTEVVEYEGLGGMEWLGLGLIETALIVKIGSSTDNWRWSFPKAWPRFVTRYSSLSDSRRKHWSTSTMGESISVVLGWKTFWSKTVSMTKLPYFVLKRLCSKDISNSRSWRATNFSGREGDLRSGLWLLKTSAVFFFLSNFSRLSITITGSGSGWDQVKTLLGARIFIFYFVIIIIIIRNF